MRDKRVAITGGAGFIGSNLAEELAVGNDVIIIDDLSTGGKENIADLIKRDNVRFTQGSILDLRLLEQTFKGIDFAFHQAALPSVTRSVEDPFTTNQVNITGTLNVLLAARNNNVKKVVYASSSSVYGDTPTLPKTEDMIPNPQSPYALTKLVGEYYCHIFQQIYDLSTICLRYFNVYGPKQSADSSYAAVIPLFIDRVAQGKPLIIYGDGEQTRDFTFVKDVVKANIIGAESDASGVFNIGRSENITVNKLAKTIINLMGKDLQPEYQPLRPGDVKHSLADISRARAIGYEPQYSLDSGLREIIKRLSIAG
ncbi:SDR family oxidoreductase [Chloroflexota bacterium]